MSEIILGIDPGVSETGWAVLESPASAPRLIASGLVKTTPDTSLPERLRRIHSAISALVKIHDPSALAVEEFFFLTAAHTIRATLQARGVILLAAAESGKPVFEYNPRAVKLALTGSGAAPKAQMQKVVQKTLKLAEPLRPDDVADAAAIALCRLRQGPAQSWKVLSSIGSRAKVPS